MKILSLCTSAGLWDKAWIEAEHQVIPACEIMPHKRVMYNTFVWDDMKYQARELVDSQRTRPQSNAAAYLIYLYRQGKQGKQNKIVEASI